VLQVTASEQVGRDLDYVDSIVHVIDDALPVFAVILAYDEGNPVICALLIAGLGSGTLGTGKSARQKHMRDTKWVRIDQFNRAPRGVNESGNAGVTNNCL